MTKPACDAHFVIDPGAWRAIAACLVGASAILTLGCASSGAPASKEYQTAEERTTAGFSDAALAPLSDLNLRRTPIPERLAVMETPYGPISFNCTDIASEVEALTELLGPDRDRESPEDEDDDELSVKASEEAADYALDTVESTTTSFIPFRSVVRRATGATAHEKALRRAYETGLQRRAYLKGVGQALNCAPPAAPSPITGQEQRIEYRGTDPDA